jgi:F0F1-type ATP synthase assembly protein I
MLIGYTSYMTNSNDKESKDSSSRSKRFVAGIIFDTSWRMFVPIIGLAVLGVIIDNEMVTKPFATIAGIIIGVTVSAVLVARQIRKD